MKKNNFKKLLISGGGIKGLAICGVLEWLEENTKILDSIEEIYGSSIGAYIGFFLGLGIPLKNIAQIFEINLMELTDIDIQLFLNEFGFDNGTKFLNLLKATIKIQGYSPTMTFEDFQKISKYKLFVSGTNINKARVEYFSVDTHPKMEVALALRISGSYPVAFTPIRIGDDLYADGAIVSPLPCDLIKKEDKKRTLCIVNHRSINNNNTDTLHSYILSILSCIIDSLTDKNIESMQHKIVLQYPLHAMDFTISFDEKLQMIEYGKEKAQEWWKKNI
jgi:predicted acylesterase/phospholipase RssA